MKVYYITEKGDKTDIFFWDPDLKVGRNAFSCLAFFYQREYAQKYLDYLKENGEEETNMVIRSQKIT